MDWKKEKRIIDREARDAAREGKSHTDCPYVDISRKNRWMEAYANEKRVIKEELLVQDFYGDKQSLTQKVENAQSIDELKEAILNFIDFLYDKNIIN